MTIRLLDLLRNVVVKTKNGLVDDAAWHRHSYLQVLLDRLEGEPLSVLSELLAEARNELEHREGAVMEGAPRIVEPEATVRPEQPDAAPAPSVNPWGPEEFVRRMVAGLRERAEGHRRVDARGADRILRTLADECDKIARHLLEGREML